MNHVYAMTMGTPIKAMISITVNVACDDDALSMVRLYRRSVSEGTSRGNRLSALSPIMAAMVSD